ncbi:hypothetical protein E2F50_03970 [Rhizobium deserti]|uniref:Uncharacterized protein n=1 Tax=Rhizobium deserti TaxID=2547961 RepID=A0A4R5UN05_9HYPH|nr:hypothetical protein [Rhizobium deserti]TDK39287.1 hypothetical protein E2F50_03970 [Rhizobium deserti]
MADFVAVIRRAVDGLATNTPETRAKVYEKARGAVQRQLENMKPRPPEDMLRRQMDKLQAAINEVEAEHREALAPVDEPYAAAAIPAADVADLQAPQETSAPAYHQAAPEPAPISEDRGRYFQDEPQEEPAPAAEAHYEAQSEPEPWAAEPEFRSEPQEFTATPEPVQAAPEPPVYDELPRDDHAASMQQSEPLSAVYSDWPETDASADAATDVPYEEEHLPATVAPPVFHEEAVHQDVFHQEAVRHETEAYQEPLHAAEPVPSAELEDDFPYPSREEQAPAPVAHEPAAVEPQWHAEPHPVEQPHPLDQERPPESWGWEEPARPAQADVAAAWDDVPELMPAGPVETIDRGPSAEGIDAHFEYETHAAADAVRMPPVSELPDLDTPAAANKATDDPFADYVDPQPKTVVQQAKEADNDPWSDLEDLIGYNSKDAAQSSGAGNSLREDDIDDFMPPPSKPYRVTPVRKRNYAGIVLGLIGLLLLGGGAYALWLNRASLNDMVDGLFQSDGAGPQTAQQTPAAQPNAPAAQLPAQGSAATPQTPGQVPAQPSIQTPPPAQAPAASQAANATTPPAADGSAANSKFTQRLMPDGNEVDEGPGGTGGLAQNAEGQSVAQLNAPPANPAPAAPAAADNAGAAPATGSPAPAGTPPAPAATPADAPALAGEKMFLYEERIGQTAPTAIDGSVSWSLQREPGANGAPPEPVVQGRITIPGRGLTALMTFKRNGDPSLPASHLIEIVFAVPPDFEGGAIESVQRIAMKQTEQDRGSALVAVPAKITDDFHMIALNDFPDARNTNLELLRTRNWIDIPVAYRNGRRALLTLQKGPEGEKAFTEAIREWGQMGGTPTGQ